MKVDTEYKKNLKPMIISEALKCFRERGLRAVKMDDISKNLHISKRTLYELYINKEELLLETLKMVHDQQQRRLHEIADTTGDVMDVLIEVLKIEVDSIVNTHPSFFSDIQQYPSAQKFLHDSYESQRHNALDFFGRGIKEGFFLSSIDYKVFMKITSNIMDSLKRYTLSKQMSMLEVVNNYVLVLMRGMCTQKGIAKIDAFLSKMEN